MARVRRPAPLIGLIGKARSGKDTVAARLVAHHGYKRAAFGDAVKGLLCSIDPYIASPGVRLSAVVMSSGWERAKELPEVRRLLQDVGVGARNYLGEDVWVRVVTREIDGFQHTPYVVADVRFPNEAQAIRARGGILVRIERPGAGLPGDRGNHVSELALENCRVDYVLPNTGTLELLYERVDLLARWAARPRDHDAVWKAATETILNDPRGGL